MGSEGGKKELAKGKGRREVNAGREKKAADSLAPDRAKKRWRKGKKENEGKGGAYPKKIKMLYDWNNLVEKTRGRG